jgi:hypothetical protein
MVCGTWWLNLERAHQADNMVLCVSNELSWVAYIGQAKSQEGVNDLPYQTQGTLEVIQYTEIHFIPQAHNMQ